MKWEELNNLVQLNQIDEESKSIKVLIFKHSTRCNISETALNRFTRDWKDEYYDIFKEAKMTYDDYPKITITGRESMIRNLDKILRNWNKKASSQQQA